MKVFRSTLALIMILMLGCNTGFARDMLQIKGSDTLINLVQKLSEVYMDETGNYIAVTGGGSGTGIAALMNGKCDIANASRNMKPKEIVRAQDMGVWDVTSITCASSANVWCVEDEGVFRASP